MDRNKEDVMADAKVCPVCGKKVSGFLSAETVGPKTIESMKLIGLDTEGWCLPCAQARLDEERRKREATFAPFAARFEELGKGIVDAILAQTTPHFESEQDRVIGIVSGHSVIGTGPLSSLASAFTDLFGEESLAYQQKIRDAEDKAMLMAKIQAMEKGASLISGMSISVSEATSGHGMLMVTCVGTALKAKNPSPIIKEYLELRDRKREVEFVQNINVSVV
ncbi:MAG: YbjQ family protein [Bilophila wadsworthia]